MANETGFGSPTILPVDTYFDWGFGSPTPVDLDTGDEVIASRDTAFGSPYDAVQSATYLPGEFDLIPDDGGVVLEIFSDWSTSGFYQGAKRGAVLGPFTVTFVNSSDGAETEGIGDIGTQCVTDFDQTRLYVGVPPLPHGTYDIKIEWFGGTRLIYIDNAFEVDVRPRCAQAYGIRMHLPDWWATGPTMFDNETVSEFDGYSSNLEAITKCIGDSLQRLYGVPATSNTSTYQYGDASIDVESTIGFPDAGALSVNGVYLEYSSKTRTSFEGVTSSLYHPDILPRTEVYHAFAR